MAKELEEFHHDLSFECRLTGADPYDCIVEGYTEDGEQITKTIENVRDIRGRGEMKHSLSYGNGKLQFWADGDCVFDPEYSGSIVYCDPYHP